MANSRLDIAKENICGRMAKQAIFQLAFSGLHVCTKQEIIRDEHCKMPLNTYSLRIAAINFATQLAN